MILTHPQEQARKLYTEDEVVVIFGGLEHEERRAISKARPMIAIGWRRADRIKQGLCCMANWELDAVLIGSVTAALSVTRVALSVYRPAACCLCHPMSLSVPPLSSPLPWILFPLVSQSLSPRSLCLVTHSVLSLTLPITQQLILFLSFFVP